MERYCCNIICGTPTTSKVKGLRLDEMTKAIKVINTLNVDRISESWNDGMTDMLKTVYHSKTTFCGGYNKKTES